MKTIDAVVKKYGLTPHPRIKNRYAIEDRPRSASRFTRHELVKFLRHKEFKTICSVFMNENSFYADGRRKEPRNAEWFKERHPDFYAAYFTDGSLNSGYDYKSLSKELQDDLDIYEGIILGPLTKIHADTIIYDATIDGSLINTKNLRLLG